MSGSSSTSVTQQNHRISWESFTSFWGGKNGDSAIEIVDRCLNNLGISTFDIDSGQAKFEVDVAKAKGDKILEKEKQAHFKAVRKRNNDNSRIVQRYVQTVDFPSLVKDERVDIVAINEFALKFLEILTRLNEGISKKDQYTTLGPVVVLIENLKTKALVLRSSLSATIEERSTKRAEQLADGLYTPLTKEVVKTELVERVRRDREALVVKLKGFEMTISNLALKQLWAHIFEYDHDVRDLNVTTLAQYKAEWANLEKKVIIPLQELEKYEYKKKNSWDEDYNELTAVVKRTLTKISGSFRDSQQARMSRLEIQARFSRLSVFPNLDSPVASFLAPEGQKVNFSSYVENALFKGEVTVDLSKLEFVPSYDLDSPTRWLLVLSKREELGKFVDDLLHGQDPFALSAFAYSEETPMILPANTVEEKNLEKFMKALDSEILRIAKAQFTSVDYKRLEEEMEVVRERLPDEKEEEIKRLQEELRKCRTASYQKIQLAKNIKTLKEAFLYAQEGDDLLSGLYTITAPQEKEKLPRKNSFLNGFLQELADLGKGKRKIARSTSIPVGLVDKTEGFQ